MSDSSAVRGSRDDRSGDARKRTSIPTFYRQVVAELRKVVYPTQEQLVTYFIVVMVFVLVMMAIVSALDVGFGKLAFAIFDGSGGV
ncbi:preprotein translocase subunit SecE [Nocardioides rubriscoriae]|uniref:preprotein translocase subunit SecE n=1 Tax=Nocardioides rubriscoriae TaxID=642762 RepID=UPI001478CA8C|nr:preprotein translocase subunit SecE [Nocardioides rubriscoriae]